jgi:tRNA(Ile)-lysidine synthase
MNKSPKYWVACSGGVDSVVLLHLMYEQKKDVGILHCNFHLREQSSNEDEAFMRNLAIELGVPIRVREFDTKQYSKDNRMNTQLAARELRYNWFDEVIQKESGTVLLGHHYDDQLETFFLQLRRGGKVKGLSGMPVFKEGYLRPILKYTKDELIALAQKYNWKWREDSTNASNDYTRNWYRNEVLPLLKNAAFPLEEVVPLMHSFQQILAFLKGIKIPKTITIEDWFAYPIWIQQHILSEHGLGEYSEHEINRLAKAEKGKFIGNETSKVWNEGNELVFVKESENTIQYELKTSVVSMDQIQLNQHDLFLDAAKVKGELSFRKWEKGDRFQPLGMKGEKLVGKFLRDRKVVAHLKENVQVLVNDQNVVLGVFGFGVGERFKMDEGTEEVVKVKVVS